MHYVIVMNRWFLIVIAIFRHRWRAFVVCFSYLVIDILLGISIYCYHYIFCVPSLLL
jgi:hypothetical protein